MSDPDRHPPDPPPIGPGIRGANMLLMFVLEMAVYVAIVWFAVTLPAGAIVRSLIAVGLFAAFATIWALLGSPKAPWPARGWLRVALEVLWFGAGVAAFAFAGQPGLGAALAILVVVNLTLRRWWRQTPTLP